jgi:hypothetical protein
MRFISFVTHEEREKLKPVAGDLLDFEGTHYVAEQVGLKYIIAHLAGDPAAKAMLKIGQVCKVVLDDSPEATLLPIQRPRTPAIDLERDVRFQ